MTIHIETIRLGTCNTYLVIHQGRALLVDGGNRGREEILFRRMRVLGLAPSDVKLILLTHAHYDHVGSLAEIRRRLPCPLAAHSVETALVDSGTVRLPPGTNALGRTVVFLGRLVGERWFRFEPSAVDLIIDEERSLEEFGLPGRVVPTPGHTPGSLSLLLPDGRALVGDVAVNFLSMPWGSVFPPFAEDPRRLLQTWEALLGAGVTTFFPAHGGPIPARRLEKALKELTG